MGEVLRMGEAVKKSGGNGPERRRGKKLVCVPAGVDNLLLDFSPVFTNFLCIRIYLCLLSAPFFSF